MTTQRDDLAREEPSYLAFARLDKSPMVRGLVERIDRDAKTIIKLEAAKPREITTVEELDALECESIIRDVDGLPKEKQADGEGGRFWASPGHAEQYTEADIILPATVLWEPQP